MIIVGLVLCLFVPAALCQRYENDYDLPFTFTCPTGQSISNIYSRHSNRREDRQYGFGCQNTPGLGNCWWSAYVNEFDQPVLFQCPGNGIISGMASYHDNRREDRRFQFYCCSSVMMLTHCAFTGYVNDYDAFFNYYVPPNRVLKGVNSFHSNRREDRRYKFETCIAN